MSIEDNQEVWDQMNATRKMQNKARLDLAREMNQAHEDTLGHLKALAVRIEALEKRAGADYWGVTFREEWLESVSGAQFAVREEMKALRQQVERRLDQLDQCAFAQARAISDLTNQMHMMLRLHDGGAHLGHEDGVQVDGKVTPSLQFTPGLAISNITGFSDGA